MDRTLHRLTSSGGKIYRNVDGKQIECEERGKRYSDGGGLSLVISSDGSRRWVFRYRNRETGTVADRGLGAFPVVSLAAARKRARDARKALEDGKTLPTKKEQSASSGEAPTFEEVLDTLIASHGPSWRNAKHRAQWKNSLTQHAPDILAMRVDQIETEHVFQCLNKIWATKSETASRVRGRIERVLDAAKVRGYRSADNPARWRGHLQTLLPKAKKLQRGHHAAMAYKSLPAFMKRLRAKQSITARCLEFTILTAARTSEATEAVWSEFDLTSRVWTIPKERMKGGREHRVPLSPRAMQILKELGKAKRGEFVFAGLKPNKPLSNMAMENLLRLMDVKPSTVHGFRSSFRDWTREQTDHPREIAEAALAHAVGDKTEQAYVRGDALDRRRSLMSDWGRFCNSTRNVV